MYGRYTIIQHCRVIVHLLSGDKWTQQSHVVEGRQQQTSVHHIKMEIGFEEGVTAQMGLTAIFRRMVEKEILNASADSRQVPGKIVFFDHSIGSLCKTDRHPLHTFEILFGHDHF